jgi:glycosyltransferase involved in cell wall biosynthesis
LQTSSQPAEAAPVSGQNFLGFHLPRSRLMKTQSPTVLFVSHDASRTGAPIFLLRFLHWLREYRQIPFQILVGSSGDMLPEFESVGRTELFVPKPTPLDRILRRLKVGTPEDSDHKSSLRKRLAESNVGLVYCNTIVNGKILDFLSFLNCPVICHVHELEQVIRLNSDETSLGLVKRFAPSFIAVSHAVKQNLVTNHGIPEDKIRVIHGFIPTGESKQTEIAQAHSDVRRELRIPAEARVVCACGSIEPRKGTDLFLKVAERVSELYKNKGPVHFIWVGGGLEQVTAMRKHVNSLSHRNTIHFIGHRKDVSSYYDASDVFLLPSREDPFPLVMMEAALRKKAIVCFDHAGGAPEFVERDAGFVVPGLDVNKMAERVVDLLTSAELRNHMGAVARQKVLDRHDISICAPKISAIIHDELLVREARVLGA